MTLTDSTGKAILNLQPNSSYQLLAVKTGYQEYRQNFSILNTGAPKIQVKLSVATSAAAQREQITDVQLLAVVYYKLGESPNPVEGFVSFEEANES